ncbi:helicase and polymerase-containing protein TEBICHI isoform X1 [Vigna unguiculata]|uniref:DNA polymerase theta subunit n=1 Tax=Vigna unguiculata TaxID=3917 RepID=A0A4D6MHH1_VIGUN|nr:helicase and polymerase-containing protein TEBICHI isoform X1 [Vigna unguiculata]QCD99446.1 DNA polymerase theta subunit [Vigna unguiculata]
MASPTHRTRLDQFYVSKKRKAATPVCKVGRSEKGARQGADASPSSKGTLDGYLIASQDGDGDSATAPNTVKRNLASEIGSFHANGLNKHTVLSAQGFDDSETSGATEFGQGAANLELKQFAAGFLSLYCSELHPSVDFPSEMKVDDHKSHGTVAEGHSCLPQKSKCTAREPGFGVENVSLNVKIDEDVKSGVVGNNTMGYVPISCSKVSDCGDTAAFETGFRKCSNTPKMSRNMAECYTPGSLIVKARVKETPKSVRGSSSFSPGEAFWNEAILLADSLCVPMGNDPSKAMWESNVVEDGPEMNNSCNLQNYDGKPRKILDQSKSRIWNMEAGTSFGLVGMHPKDSGKEASSLPVKHFDFSFEDNSLEENTMQNGHVGDQSNDTYMAGKQYGSGPTTSHTYEEKNEVQEKTLVNKLGKRNCHGNVSMTSNSPHNEVRTPISAHETDEANTPSTSVSFNDHFDLNSWLPPEICNIYRKKGISNLYNWQVDCLRVDGVLQRRNLVYCASTSAGKSFVAEILMLRRVITTGKMALLVLPYVSICAEKAEHLERLLEPLGKHVRSYYGNQGGGTLPKDTSVAVCTIEKANSLINKLLEEGRLSEMGIIVIDELHMVGDPRRGYLLELMLTKLRYAAGEGIPKSSDGESSGGSSDKADPAQGLQIVGMSATMPNVAAVADWLQAALYQTEFRPVPLEEYVKVGNSIYSKNMELSRTISKVADLGGKDPDHVVELCNEVVQEGQSVLIFCSSRKGCESTARHIAKFLKRFTVDVNDCEFADITSAINALRKCPGGLDPILEETLPSGVAFHHAGLTVEEREIVETCYRKGLIRVLTATSTLAAGVNLPARRVIFRQPRIGCDFLDGTRYKQMAGRAGRTGIDTKGESILICKPEEVKKVTALLNKSCPPLHSCLSEDMNGMTHAILEVVAGGIVQTASDINRYVRCTLLNSTKSFQDVVKSAQESLRWLCQRKFLEWNEDTKLYNTTPLGRASFGSSLCPEESLIVLADLSRAREGFVLASDLHLVYLVTPINVDVEPDWELFYEHFVRLSPLDQSVGNRVGVTEPFLMHMAHGAPLRAPNKSRHNTRSLHNQQRNQLGISNATTNYDDQTLRICRRFYVSLILSLLVQETPVGEVCEAFKVARGMVQSLQENAGRFASMVAVFCERLGWQDLEGLVAKFQNRVSFGVRAEIVELTTIPYVKGSRARSLYKAGLRTPLAIAEASIPEIVKALFESSSWATEGSAQRSLQFGLAKKIKNGARKIVLEKAEEASNAAFSAFKSLGFSVPQFAPRILSTAPHDSIRQEAGSTSGSDTTDTSHNFVDANHIVNSIKFTSDKERKELIKLSVSGALAPVEEKSSNRVLCSLSTFPVAGPTMDEKNGNFDLAKNPDMSHFSAPFQKPKDISCVKDGCHAHCTEEQHKNGNLASGNSGCSSKKGPINAVSCPGGLDSFLDIWDTVPEFYFDIHYIKRLELHSAAPFEIRGIAVCWENSPVYYVNLPRDILFSDKAKDDCLSMSTCSDKQKVSSSKCNQDLEIARHRWSRISKIIGKRNVRKYTWNSKIQIQVLKSPAFPVQRFRCLDTPGTSVYLEVIDNSYVLFPSIHVQDAIDLCIVAWILWPDEESSYTPDLDKEVKKRLSSEEAAVANQSGRWRNQMRRAAHDGCCHRVAQTRALCSVLWKLLISENLAEVLMRIEIPLVNVLADMELWGIGVDLERCIQARKLLVNRLKHLEKEAYKLAGITFSLNMPADIAKVLYEHLKLPIPNVQNKGKQHPSTGKHCLDALRHEHPIVPVIKEHRTMAKLLNSTLGSICSLARLSVSTQKYTIHGHWCQTSTATGRLSMEEPNLQCVEHTVHFKIKEEENEGDANESHCSINARDFFVPTQENWLLLTADYSQIELRLMAHFSKDSSLVELLSKPDGDVFTMMAARWTGCSEVSVDSQEREQIKRMVYGILYGMGVNSLAEQLDCTSDEAAEKIANFKSSFPGVASWLREAVASCRSKGYVETLKGRKRFLSKIKFGSRIEKSKAQRQAVNSICQGSAADIIKIAMIRIYSEIAIGFDSLDSSSSVTTEFQMLKDRCRILLQVHDELVLEVDPSVIKEAALLLQTSMENAVSLLVPLRVKLKVGRTWGSLEPFTSDKIQG